jgi:hypothetical protein
VEVRGYLDGYDLPELDSVVLVREIRDLGDLGV